MFDIEKALMTIANDTSQQRVQRFLDTVEHCKVLGISIEQVSGAELTLKLPYSEKIVGNPDSGVIHGGALTTLMDSTCGFSVICALPEFEICPTLDLRIDYMRPAEPHKAVYATAYCYRITNSIIFTRGSAYQDDKDRPVAKTVATFMRLGPDAMPLDFREMMTGGLDGI